MFWSHPAPCAAGDGASGRGGSRPDVLSLLATGRDVTDGRMCAARRRQVRGDGRPLAALTWRCPLLSAVCCLRRRRRLMTVVGWGSTGARHRPLLYGAVTRARGGCRRAALRSEWSSRSDALRRNEPARRAADGAERVSSGERRSEPPGRGAHAVESRKMGQPFSAGLTRRIPRARVRSARPKVMATRRAARCCAVGYPQCRRVGRDSLPIQSPAPPGRPAAV